MEDSTTEYKLITNEELKLYIGWLEIYDNSLKYYDKKNIGCPLGSTTDVC